MTVATAADRAAIRRWAGTSFDEAEVDEAIERLQSPYAVALELLMVRLADLTGTAAVTRAGKASADHTKNIAATEEQIARLVGYIRANEGDITLSSAAEDLLDEAAGDSSAATAVISISQPNSRRAG